MPHFQFCTE